MITTVSIVLYGLAVFFAAGLGATSQKYKKGEDFRNEATLGVSLTAIPFVLGIIIQVIS